MIGYEITFMPHNATYHNVEKDRDKLLGYKKICKLSQKEDMKPLTPEVIRAHPIGIAAVAEWWGPHNSQHVGVGVYAGITGFEEFNGKELAVIGALIALPWARGWGLGLETVKTLEEAASTETAVQQFGHQGFMARCNEHSQRLTAQLGFSEQGVELGKAVMVKEFAPTV